MLYMYIIYSIHIYIYVFNPVVAPTKKRLPVNVVALPPGACIEPWQPIVELPSRLSAAKESAIVPGQFDHLIMKSIGKDLRHININLTGMETSNTHNFVKVTYIYVIYVFIRFCLTHMYIILSHVLYQSMVEKMGYTYI